MDPFKESMANLLRVMRTVKEVADAHLELARTLGNRADDVVTRFARDVLSQMPVVQGSVDEPMGDDAINIEGSASSACFPMTRSLVEPSPQDKIVVGARALIRSNLINRPSLPPHLRPPSSLSDMGPPPITPFRFGHPSQVDELEEIDDSHDGFSSRLLFPTKTQPELRGKSLAIPSLHAARSRQKDTEHLIDKKLDVPTPSSPKQDLRASIPPALSSHRPFRRTHKSLTLSFGAPAIQA
ncbi:hypothetical protein MIND_01257200 [Mycena indigotica]|uniref:Uncharacterized protein n=1 Tax=Mycena indigotica TaxID=2126181 RepID=A0A8H6S0M1_9AGAR|nr:uncharacterized protein MIND_01257200 [Mycena indigotica]KAF7291140.1 hypothetical protein MIND_01257200 [Mycena indigotica]